MQSVQEIVRSAEDVYTKGNPTQAGKYVSWSMYETIETIYAYLNSKHISGSKDSKERDKPFFNIVTAVVNIWYRATDIDRKNIRIKADKSEQVLPSFIATQLLQDWMKTAHFGAFLNKWGRTQAAYGSAVTKFVETEGELVATVIPWNRMVCDTVDFASNPQIEVLQFTPAQLRQNKSYDQDMVESLIDAVSSRELLDGQTVDETDNFIKCHEMHANESLSLLTDKEKDENTYRQQMHVVSFVENKDGEFDDFTLFRGKEKQSPYLLTHLIEEDNRTLSKGAVETLFDAQWMKNHTIKQTKDFLDLIAKQIYQTADGSFVGNNVLETIETGDILIHDVNKPITTVSHNTSATTELANSGADWEGQGKESTNTPDAQRGNTMPSGTAYRQVAILEQSSGSLFELMTENRGLSIEEMMRLFILPFLMKQMNSTEEVGAVLDSHDIEFIDKIFVPKKAIKNHNKKAIEAVLAGEIAQPFDPAQGEAEVKESLALQGNQRFFKPSELSEKKWNEVLTDFGKTVTVEVTNENIDKEAMFTTLTSLLEKITKDPTVLQNPDGRKLFNRIMEETGRFSPLELQSGQTTQTNAQVGGANELNKLAEGEQDPNKLI